MKKEAYFIGHCDFEGCDLGTFEYTCPFCCKHNTDYEIWWKQDSIYGGLIYEFKSECCNKDLKVYYDDNDCVVEEMI